MTDASKPHKNQPTWKTVLTQLVITSTMIAAILVVSAVLMTFPKSTLEHCTVISKEVTEQSRRSLPYLKLQTSCGKLKSYNIAHRSLIKPGETYTFYMQGIDPSIEKAVNENPEKPF